MALYTVDTDGVSGDHASLDAAVSAIIGLGTMTEDHTITCYASTGVEDSAAVSFSLLDTSSYRLTIQRGDANYVLRTTGTTMGLSREQGHTYNITVDGLRLVRHGQTGDYASVVSLYAARAGLTIFSRCTIETEAHSFREEMISVRCDGAYSHQGIFVNCVVISRGSSGSPASRVFEIDSGSDVGIYNCTIVAAGAGEPSAYYSPSDIGDDDNARMFNNLFVGCQDPSRTPGAGDYNATDAAWTLGGAHDRSSQTFSFVGSGDDPYMLEADDTGALDHGTDLSADAVYPFSVDKLGTERPQGSAWDIGAFERAVALPLPHLIYG